MPNNQKLDYAQSFNQLHIRALFVFSLFIFAATMIFFIATLKEPKIELEPVLPFASPPSSTIENADYSLDSEYIPVDMLPLDELDFYAEPPSFDEIPNNE